MHSVIAFVAAVAAVSNLLSVQFPAYLPIPTTTKLQGLKIHHRRHKVQGASYTAKVQAQSK